MKRNNSKYRGIFYFVLPVILFVCICILMGVAPFGNKSFLISDMYNQYIDYFGYFKSIISGENDIFYTFSKSLGGDMVGLMAYYLMSPLNVIFLFFSSENLVYAITILIAVKLGLCGLTSGIYLEKITGKTSYVWLFSTSYALMSYNVTYCFNIMWIDGVYVLPVIALGIEHIINKKGKGLYIFALTYALIVNYYIGYMLCIFSVIYYVSRQILCWDENIFENIRSAFRFGVSSLLSGGLAAVFLVPVFKSLEGTKAVLDTEIFKFEMQFPAVNILLKLFGGTVTEQEMIDGLPNIYCGLLITILAILYFTKKEITIKEKICSAGIVAVFVISFSVVAVNLVWHGFNPPSWFPFRYSFVFSFFLVTFACKAWNTKDEKSKGWSYAVVVAGLILVLINAGILAEKHSFLNKWNMTADIMGMIVITVALYFAATKKCNLKRPMIILITIIQFLSLVINGTSIKNISFTDTDAFRYKTNVSSMNDGVEWVKAYDDSFYRMEKTFSRTQNDPMQLNYSGLSHFSSTEKTFVKDFLGNLGFRNNGNWVAYREGSSVAAESFVGLKYIISEKTSEKPYNLVGESNGYYIYENPYALPIGIITDKNVMDTELQDADLFARQNQIYSALTGEETHIFSQAEILSVEYENLNVGADGSAVFVEKQNNETYGVIRYKVNAANDDLMYIYIDCGFEKDAELVVNGVSYGGYLGVFDWHIRPIGRYNQGDIIDIEIHLNADYTYIYSETFYHENDEILKNAVDTINSWTEKSSLQKLKSSNIVWSGEVLEEKILMFTIPSENGWKVYVDGKEEKILSVFDTLIGVNVDSGAHIVELKYAPVGLKTGALITVVSAFAVAIWLLIDKRKSK